MSNKRMFSMKIVDSDAFLDMPTSSQNLYFHLAMRADDEGFVSNPKRIMRMTGASDDDYKILIAKRFVLIFESGVCVIKHWFIHNTLKKDRFTPSVYLEEKAQLSKKENKAYTERKQNGNILETQYSIDKISIEKKRERGTFVPPSLEEVKEYIQLGGVNVNAEQWFNFYESKGWMVGKNKMKNWKSAVKTWAIRDKGNSKINPLDQEAIDLVKQYGQEKAYWKFLKTHPPDDLLKVKHIINL